MYSVEICLNHHLFFPLACGGARVLLWLPQVPHALPTSPAWLPGLSPSCCLLLGLPDGQLSPAISLLADPGMLVTLGEKAQGICRLSFHQVSRQVSERNRGLPKVTWWGQGSASASPTLMVYELLSQRGASPWALKGSSVPRGVHSPWHQKAKGGWGETGLGLSRVSGSPAPGKCVSLFLPLPQALFSPPWLSPRPCSLGLRRSSPTAKPARWLRSGQRPQLTCSSVGLGMEGTGLCTCPPHRMMTSSRLCTQVESELLPHFAEPDT